MRDLSLESGNGQSAEQDTGYVSAPSAVSLPKGGGAIQGIGEKFDVNPITGTGSLSIPIAVSPGRSGFSPQFSLSYDSGAGNSPFGLGWNFGVSAITRKTQKGLPKYHDAEDSDIFLLSGAEDLVPTLIRQVDDWVRDVQTISVPTQVIDTELIPADRVESVLSSYPHTGAYTVQRYRPRIESLFARIERWRHQETGDVHWRSVTKDNITSVYGKTLESRIVDPTELSHVFEWLLCESYDDKGNVILYQYKQEDSSNINIAQVQERNRLTNGHSYTNQYLKRVFYGNRNPYERDNWLFQVVFDYGEHGTDDPRLDDSTLEELSVDERLALDNPTPDDAAIQTWSHRPDAFSTFRSGFEIRTQRLCRRVLMFHQFEALDTNWTLVRSTDFRYEKDLVATYLIAATQTGYVRETATTYRRRSYPPLALTYDRPEINETIQTIDAESLKNLPVGLDGSVYRWLDLDGEGISGILTEQAEGWFYKANLGAAEFAPVQLVATRPSVSNLQDSRQRLVDLAGDGQQDLVVLSGGLAGFYERGLQQDWIAFKRFESVPNVNWDDPNLRLVDLNGDGHADILISEHEVFVWYPSKAEEGFDASSMTRKLRDEEQGPALVFADVDQSVYLSDMTGDGLNDILRIRNGDVCYWPNMGYGRFGAKVTMGQAPYFDHPELFEQRRIRLADIDGSGTTDIIYLGRETVSLWLNQAGNSWREPHRLRNFPKVDSLASVQVVDLLGNGTACLVWSSPLPGKVHRRMQYIDLMGAQKPHLLRLIQNNLGAEIRLHYAPSTQFYLADKQAGTPWITKIPFPVHVVDRVETIDRISGNRFVSSYRYRHGYFDGEEREFRGFGYVEQLDTEAFAAFQEAGSSNATDAAFHVPPVLTKTWFHTGFYRDRKHISQLFAEEYYTENAQAILLADTIFPAGLTLPEGTLPEGTLLPQRLTPQEAHEVCRALKGSVLRQEVYALDESDQSEHAYTVSESNYEVRWLQPRGERQYGVFFAHPREALSYAYDRDPSDPRISHSLTLAVDMFGTVLKSATVVYPRRAAQLPSHPVVRSAQTQTFITYSEVDVIHRSDGLTFYRIGLPFEARAYEITGLQGSEEALFTVEGLLADIEAADDIAYEVQPTDRTVQKRLVERDCIQYRRNDQTEPLPLGEVESLALPFQTFRVAFTPALLERIYGDRVDNLLLMDEGRYVLRDGLWWIPSGRQVFDAEHFYLPIQAIDPFQKTYTTTYDNYDLLTVKTEDPLGNRVVVDNDYRVLQPRQITDPNQNRAEVLFDVLGMVVATAVMGKAGDSQGDVLDETVRADLLLSEIEAFWADPLGTAASLLGNASTRVVYDLERFRISGEPVVAATLARETHVAEALPPEGLKIQVGFGYSDGFGREIQTKIQAEPGLAPERDADGVLRCDRALVETNPRWVGTGRTIYNNKGNPVKQYEPFFSPTHLYESETELVECGVTPILLYDPIQRVVATLAPNHTYSKVVFDSWQQATWDANDTLTEETREDFIADENVGGYFARLNESDYLPTWFSRYSTGTPVEQDAATKAVAHAGTPSVVHLDTLGRPILTVEDNGAFGQYETQERLDIESNPLYVVDARGNAVMVYAMVTRDVQGNPLLDAQGNPIVETTGYNLLGHSLYLLSAETGERWTLNNVAGNPIRGWDSRGFETRLVYDELQRPTHMFVREGEAAEVLAERTVYGDRHPEATQRGLKGQVFRQFDSAGAVTNWAFDFKGNLLRSSRQLAQDYKEQIDWAVVSELAEATVPELTTAAASLMEPQVFDVISTFDALGRPLSVIGPDGSETIPTYNEANLLEATQVRIRDAEVFTPFVINIDYDAKGQRQLIEYGNGVRTEYTYDRETFRLTRLLTTRTADNARLQDLSYTYDPVGNITSIRDDAQQPIFFNGEVVSANSDYTYDSLYQLRQATGREHIGQTANDLPQNRPELKPHYDFNDFTRRNLAHPHDGQAMRNYTERYSYDGVGNILEMLHEAAGGTWTRRYSYADNNNRLLSTSLPGDDVEGSYSAQYEYDTHGNMIQMPHLPLMEWTFKDQLHASSKQVVNNGGTPEITYYLYNAAGQRVRKVTERQSVEGETPTRLKERIYLGGIEIYREYSVDSRNVMLERETLHVMNSQQRIAVVETKTLEDNENIDSPIGLQSPIVRYLLSNHIGSVNLELSRTGDIISYEEYYPFGTTAYQAGQSVAETSLKRFRYTGKERDEETGLSYHGARYFVPWLARWTAADPVGMVDGTNIYAYSINNPIILSDPLGTKSVVSVSSNPDVAYRNAREDYVSNLNQFNSAVAGFKENKNIYSPEVQQDIQDSIDYARGQLQKDYRALLEQWRNLPAARERFAISQHAKNKERERVLRTFNNAEGFVNRAALFVGTSLFGGWLAATAAVAGGGVVITSAIGGGASGGTYSGGEALLRQEEAGEELDFGLASEKAGEGAAYGALTGAVLGVLGKFLPRIPGYLRRTPKSSGLAETSQLREAAAKTGQALKKSKNVGVGKANIEGNKASVHAVSGKKQPNLPGGTNVPSAAGRHLPAADSKSRPVDSERLILERFARIIPKYVGGSRVRGTVTVFSERVPCSACQEAATAFETLYEGAIKVFFSNGGVK